MPPPASGVSGGGCYATGNSVAHKNSHKIHIIACRMFLYQPEGSLCRSKQLICNSTLILLAQLKVSKCITRSLHTETGLSTTLHQYIWTGSISMWYELLFGTNLDKIDLQWCLHINKNTQFRVAPTWHTVYFSRTPQLDLFPKTWYSKRFPPGSRGYIWFIN